MKMKSFRTEKIRSGHVHIARKRIIQDINDPKSQTSTASARYLIDKHDGLARKNVHVEQDVTIRVERKSYADPVPVDGKVIEDAKRGEQFAESMKE
jgi:hypothetical protein